MNTIPDLGAPRLGRLFISSVFREMMDLRKCVADAALQAGFDAVLTEKVIAQP